MRTIELVSVHDQKLRDENNLKLGKKIKDITKLSENKWKVRDSDTGGNFFRPTYRIVETVGDKINCDMICSQFKWERNRHPNCKHVQAVMILEKKKFKTYIPIEWEIIFLNSELEREFARYSDLNESISKEQKILSETKKTIKELKKKMIELRRTESEEYG